MPEGVFDGVVLVVFGLLLVALVLAFVRVVRGPLIPDRVAALEHVNVLTVSMVALATVFLDEAAFIDASVALALIAFVSTVAFTRFMERNEHRER